MKRLLALLLILFSLFTLSGCGVDEQAALDLAGDVLFALLDDGETDREDAGAYGSGYSAGFSGASNTVSSSASDPLPFEPDDSDYADLVTRDGWYDDVETVAAYLIVYDELPDNYLTKQEARDLGWVQQQGNLWDVADGMSIGGDYFGNYEGLLPDGEYRECDIDYDGGSRGAERLVFTVEGELYIYYTDDHYETFELIYAED